MDVFSERIYVKVYFEAGSEREGLVRMTAKESTRKRSDSDRQRGIV